MLETSLELQFCDFAKLCCLLCQCFIQATNVDLSSVRQQHSALVSRIACFEHNGQILLRARMAALKTQPLPW